MTKEEVGVVFMISRWQVHARHKLPTERIRLPGGVVFRKGYESNFTLFPEHAFLKGCHTCPTGLDI